MPSPKLDPYLTFNGNCAEAFEFYRVHLGAKIEALVSFKDSPMAADVAPEFQSRTMHAKLLLDGQVLMASDAPPGMPYSGMHGFALALNFPTVAKAQAVFEALSSGGAISMPFGKTFWAEGFSMFSDRFGVPWMIGCEKEV